MPTWFISALVNNVRRLVATAASLPLLVMRRRGAGRRGLIRVCAVTGCVSSGCLVSLEGYKV